MDISTDVEHHIQMEMPMGHIMTQLIQTRPEAWKRAHLVCRDDQHHGYVVGSTVLALASLVQDVVT